MSSCSAAGPALDVAAETVTRCFRNAHRNGGVLLKGYGSRIVVNNTLDERLRLLEERMLPEIRESLFGKNENRRVSLAAALSPSHASIAIRIVLLTPNPSSHAVLLVRYNTLVVDPHGSAGSHSVCSRSPTVCSVSFLFRSPLLP